MGLPGSGKTTLASKLAQLLDACWYNADEIRKLHNDWDFSPAGRIRQAQRLAALCDLHQSDQVIADFVAALPEQRDIFAADFTVWMDTIAEGRFEDTNKAFIPPENYDVRVTEQNAEKWSNIIASKLLAYRNQ